MTARNKLILLCQGGAGDVLAHTPMIRYFRNAYPKDEIIVLCTYKQLLEHNPNIDTLIPLRDIGDFYSTHVLGQPIRFFKKHFVYDAIMDEAAIGCKTLPEFICKLYGAEFDGKPLDYFIQENERTVVKTFLGQYKHLNKKIVLLQCTGAIASDGNYNKTNNLKDLNVKMVSEIVKKHSEKILFVQIGLQGEPVVEGAIDALGQPMREAVAMIEQADGYIFIESLFAHCSNALQKRGVVVFQNTDPKFFGYGNNVNVQYTGNCPLAPCNRPVGALIDFMPGYRNPKTREKLLWECPDQVCARMPMEQLEEALFKSLEPATQSVQTTRGDPALDAIRNLPIIPPEVTLQQPEARD